MKRVLFLFALVVMCVACSDDDNNPISVTKESVELLSGDEHTIGATAELPLTYTSGNEYVAKVTSAGVIKAMRLGETDIVVSDGQNEVKVKVKVNPRSNLYVEPCLEWGISKSDLIKKFGTPDKTTSGGISYQSTSTVAPMVMYLFDSNDKLTSAGVLVNSSYSSELGSFLGERYVQADRDEENYSFTMVNGLTEKTMNMVIVAKIYNLQYWLVAYGPITNKSKAVSDFPDASLFKGLDLE